MYLKRLASINCQLDKDTFETCLKKDSGELGKSDCQKDLIKNDPGIPEAGIRKNGSGIP